MQDNNKLQQEQSAGSENVRPSVEEAVNATVPDAEAAPQKPKKSWKKELREWIVSLAAALMVVFFIRSFLFQIIRVDGDSMYSTLLNNERLFVTIPDVRLNGVERGDIVICRYPNRGITNFVKRAVAVPGDTIYRECGVTHVVYETTDANGETVTVDEMLDERYSLYFPLGSSDDYEAYTLGEDEYFVLGDNRDSSNDSRRIGPLPRRMLVGRVRRVIFPFGHHPLEG